MFLDAKSASTCRRAKVECSADVNREKCVHGQACGHASVQRERRGRREVCAGKGEKMTEDKQGGRIWNLWLEL